VTRQRLDESLVLRKLVQSRSRARDAILRGTVWVNGTAARKPSQTVLDSDTLRVDDIAQRYVSRSALKLLHGLQHFNIAPKGRSALDIGASTGGFTQVLLEQGAAHVTAIDVGHGQIADQLTSDVRVTIFEELNAKDLQRQHISEGVDLIVCDVSFISLKLALLAALDLVAKSSELIALVKPQFEVGREFVGKGGLVTDPQQHVRVCNEVADFLEQHGWAVKGLTHSPIEGGDGNAEFLIAAVKR
jgi:23S rRNA (cytidine1920-2'-O)/16S rRNA (cytidine1409-2'-O)-methyltransferase